MVRRKQVRVCFQTVFHGCFLIKGLQVRTVIQVILEGMLASRSTPMSDVSPLFPFLTGLQSIGSQTPGMRRHKEKPYHREGQPSLLLLKRKQTLGFVASSETCRRQLRLFTQRVEDQSKRKMKTRKKMKSREVLIARRRK